MKVEQMIARPSESLHWYTRTGEPAYEVPRADGQGLRPTTVRDARKLDLVPSVTSIIRQAAAPGLDIWKQHQVLLASLTLPRGEKESDKSYMDRVMRDSREQARKAADLGTNIHGAIQGAIEGRKSQEHLPIVEGARKTLAEAFGEVEWRCERSFAHALGFGGKIDLSDPGIIGDIKTKEFSEPPKAYDEHAMQIAAYAAGLEMFSAHTQYFNLFVSTSNPGLCHVHVWTYKEIKRAWVMFESLLGYWKAKNLEAA